MIKQFTLGERVDLTVFTPVCLPYHIKEFREKEGSIYGRPEPGKIFMHHKLSFQVGEVWEMN